MLTRPSPAPLFSVAPMLDWSDRHCRYFLRLLSQHALLYTEMITTGAILYGNRERTLGFDLAEKPVILQLGGSDPNALAECARIGEAMGYDAINLNVGCPSGRVQQGKFGACLMAEPQLVANCVNAMRAAVKIPVTVKTRIGIDAHDSYELLHTFIDTVAEAGCDTFIIHARKAWLKGLSPKENREIPPLRYDVAAQLVNDFPRLSIILNGGIHTLTEVEQHLKTFAGVMLGRAIVQQPYLLSDVDHVIYQKTQNPFSPQEILQRYLPYLETHHAKGAPLSILTRPLMGLFHGLPGARQWRRSLTGGKLDFAAFLL